MESSNKQDSIPVIRSLDPLVIYFLGLWRASDKLMIYLQDEKHQSSVRWEICLLTGPQMTEKKVSLMFVKWKYKCLLQKPHHNKNVISSASLWFKLRNKVQLKYSEELDHRRHCRHGDLSSTTAAPRHKCPGFKFKGIIGSNNRLFFWIWTLFCNNQIWGFLWSILTAKKKCSAFLFFIMRLRLSWRCHLSELLDDWQQWHFYFQGDKKLNWSLLNFSTTSMSEHLKSNFFFWVIHNVTEATPQTTFVSSVHHQDIQESAEWFRCSLVKFSPVSMETVLVLSSGFAVLYLSGNYLSHQQGSVRVWTGQDIRTEKSNRFRTWTENQEKLVCTHELWHHH